MGKQCAVVVVVGAVLLAAGAASATITSSFELRTTAPDTILNPGESLPLEIWLTLSSDTALPNVQGVSVSLQASATNVITFNSSSLTSTVPGFSLAPRASGTNDSPNKGDFGWAFYGLPAISWPNGTARRLATFSVTAMSPTAPQTIEYAFGLPAGVPQRTWAVTFTTGSGSVAGASPGGLAIQVLPEPTTALLLVGGLVFAFRLRRM